MGSPVEAKQSRKSKFKALIGAAKPVRRAMHTMMDQDSMKDDRLPLLTKLIFSAPTAGTLPVIVLIAAFVNSLYELSGADLTLISACIAGARSLDVLTDPIMSYLTDSVKEPIRSRFGRRRPFMVIGCLFYGLALFLLLSPPYASSGAVGIWFALTYVSYFFANTFANIPYDALGPELTDNYDDRSSLFFMAGCFEGVGTLFAVSLPVFMQTLTSRTSYNEDICQSSADRDANCLNGLTCSQFLSNRNKPFVVDTWYSAQQKSWLLAQALTNLTKVCQDPNQVANQYNDQDPALQRFCFCRSTCDSQCNLANQRTGFKIVGIMFGSWYVVAILIAVWWIRERVQVNKDAVIEAKAEASKSMKQVSSTQTPCEALNAEDTDQIKALANQKASATIHTEENEAAEAYATSKVEGASTAHLGNIEAEEVNTPPIVPTVLSTMQNTCFAVLLPSWVCDGMVAAVFAALVTYYVRYVIAPEYQTQKEHGRECARGLNAMPSSPDFNQLCRTETVLAVCMVCALFSALLATPLWLHLNRRLGKVNTWLLWSLVMACTNFLFVLPGRGDIAMCVVICCLNGMPMGAKFLADAILADIIDYDEFLTGERREATYTMFRSFLPKIMSIPAAAIPISLINFFGHRPPVDGMIQEQPEAVIIFIKVCSGVVTTGVSLISLWLKRQYPLKTKEQVDMVSDGVSLHLMGNPAKEPITGKDFSLTKFTQEELPAVWMLDHFPGSEVADSMLEDKAEGLQKLLFISRASVFFAVVVFISSTLGTILTMGPLNFMSNEKLSFIPTLCVISAGASIVYVFFSIARLRAAMQLEKAPPSQKVLLKVQQQRRDFEAIMYRNRRGNRRERGELEDGSSLPASLIKLKESLESRIADSEDRTEKAQQRADAAERAAHRALEELAQLRAGFEQYQKAEKLRKQQTLGPAVALARQAPRDQAAPRVTEVAVASDKDPVASQALESKTMETKDPIANAKAKDKAKKPLKKAGNERAP